jgi:hypothetical protein
VSTASELRIFGDLFTFVNPRWEATARSGDTEVTEGSFTFDSATVLGVPRSAPEALGDLREFEYGLEQLLYPFGVKLDLPEVEVTDGRVRVSPMAFRVVDPPFGSQVLAPFFGTIQPMREAAVRQAVEEDCRNALAVTLIDVILGVAAGSGAIEVLAGGVDVFTADTDFSSPPLEPLPALAVPPEPLMPEPLAPAFDPGPALDPVDLGPPEVPETLPVAEVRTVVDPERVDGPQEQAMMPSGSSRFEDSDVGAAAVAVGIAGLLGALGLAHGERLMGRRRSRSAA